MAKNDHFVAQTYLRQFVGGSGMMHGYKKSDGKHFPCHPPDVCHEVDGDSVKDFLSTPNALGDFRKIFEPAWQGSVREVIAERIGPEVKFQVAGYMANLLVTTPAAVRIQREMYSLSAIELIRIIEEGKRRAGRPDAAIAKALREVDTGRVVLETEPEFIRAKMTKALMHFAWQIYNADWTILHNHTGTAFLTSDNPMAFEDPPPFKFGVRLPRYVPLTPTCCLVVVPQTERIEVVAERLHDDPQGKLWGANATPERVEAINDAVIRCAEELVISSNEFSEELAQKVAAFSLYRMGVQLAIIPQPDGVIQGFQYRSWNPADHPPVLRFSKRQ